MEDVREYYKVVKSLAFSLTTILVAILMVDLG